MQKPAGEVDLRWVFPCLTGDPEQWVTILGTAELQPAPPSVVPFNKAAIRLRPRETFSGPPQLLPQSFDLS